MNSNWQAFIEHDVSFLVMSQFSAISDPVTVTRESITPVYQLNWMSFWIMNLHWPFEANQPTNQKAN
jgi:hypothetical protein